jgi:NADPH:quinone reductase-like Zn-dependent oxidoreductase
MATQKAIVAKSPGHAELVANHPIPTPRDAFILVRTVAVALNPTDWKHIDRGTPGCLVGCDYAGIVEAVGKGVTKDFKKGDRVYGPVHGCDRYRPENGAFAEFIVAKGDLQCKIPDNRTFEEAATLPIGILTVGQGMYQHLGLASPSSPETGDLKKPILIYGGSSATGSLAIQFARL